MARDPRAAVSVLLLCVAAIGLGACGGDDGDEASEGASKSGGSLVGTSNSAPDFLDPALSGTIEGWQAMWTVYTPLLTYPHEAGTAGGRLTPGLAKALPEISADKKTYKLTLRDGLKYSDGSAVKASDFEHTIKRIFNLDSIGASLFAGIEGAEKYLKDGKARADLSGIETDDATGEITVKLTSPNGSFANVLATNYAGIVPGDTPFQNMTKTPPPGVGPYKLENVEVGRSFDLVKVPGFAVDGLQAGKLDKITMKVVKSRRRSTQDVIRNELDFMTNPPAPDQVASVREQFADKRYRQFPLSAVYYFFLNEKIAPFDDKRVRQAVNHAFDRRAISRLAAGLVAPSCNFLPPEMAGYEKIDPCPYEPPSLDKAKALIKEAGAEGAEVSVFGNDEPETKASVEYLTDVMNQIGLKARPRTLEGSAYYGYLANQTAKVQAGFNSYGQDYPNPATFMFLIDGRLISPSGNPNFGNIDDPEINKLIDSANATTSLDAAAEDYAAIDRRLVEEAHIVPYGTRQWTAFVSERVDFDNCVTWHPVYNVDFTQLCLK